MKYTSASCWLSKAPVRNMPFAASCGELTWMRLKMPKQKRKLTAAEKAEKKRRSLEYMTIFINGKQKRVKRPQLIDGIDADEFIRRNADPIWLHQAEMWEEMNTEEADEMYGEAASDMPSQACDAIAYGRKQ